MDIKLLTEVSWGGNKLAPIVDEALKMLKWNYKYELIENPKILAKLGIKNSPAMIVNDKIIIEGRIPNVLQMIEILENIKKQMD